jgi:prepilin-type N-terminal cleavage/methylation domain-containing protein
MKTVSDAHACNHKSKIINHKSSGFTLIELLTVVTIIGVLIALLLPAAQAAREAARRLQCTNNLKQIGLGLHNYHATQGVLPPGNINVSTGTCPGGSTGPTYSYSCRFGNWMIALLPYVEQSALFDRYDCRYWNQSDQNQTVRETIVPTYLCPSDAVAKTPVVPADGFGGTAAANVKYAPASYRAVSGRSDDAGVDDGVYYLDSEMVDGAYRASARGPIHGVYPQSMRFRYRSETFDNIKDGLSNTLMVGESTTATGAGYRAFWAYSYSFYSMSGATAQSRTLWGDYDRCVAASGPGYAIPCKHGWGSFHGDIINFVFCDGSVHPINTNIDMTLFTSLATIDGGENVLSY